MEQLLDLLEQLHNAQSWCDHNGDHNTGMVSLSVDTLEIWEQQLNDAIKELSNANPKVDN